MIVSKIVMILLFPGVSAKLNIIYALDGSASVAQKTFSAMKRFVNGALKSYTISPNKTHVGLTVYGGMNPVRALSTEDGTSNAVVEQAMAFMDKVGGKRNFEKALDSAANDLILKSKRKGVSKLIVLITTGKDEGNDVEKLKAVGRSLKDNGIKVAVVVIGKDTGKDDLQFVPFFDEGVMSVPSVDDLPTAVDFVEKAGGKASGDIHLRSFRYLFYQHDVFSIISLKYV